MRTSSENLDASMRSRLAGTRIIDQLAVLSPAYFGMVMATGIVSLAAYLLGMPFIANVLFQFNMIVYVALCFLSVLHMVLYPRRFFGNIIDHVRGPGYFTVVAATGILGGQFLILATDYQVSFVLWVIALLFWIVLTYAIFTGLTVTAKKPALDKGISGAWLLAVVATQSIAALSALLATHVKPSLMLEVNFLALTMWLWGGMLYVWMMALIFYRCVFFPLSPDDLSPSYWINMGAMAISTLAGSLLIANASDAPLLVSLLPFIKGVTVLYWAAGTWWIPILVMLGIWRYVYKRHPVKYDPLYWSVVFPLGMYTVSTDRMSAVMELDFLALLPTSFFYIALVAWSIAFIGFVFDLLRRIGILRL
ncbi:MAG: tellurite resistance/C4-dicarboxylate transporter family protein [Spongiibacteraceae bacterium]